MPRLYILLGCGLFALCVYLSPIVARAAGETKDTTGKPAATVPSAPANNANAAPPKSNADKPKESKSDAAKSDAAKPEPPKQEPSAQEAIAALRSLLHDKDATVGIAAILALVELRDGRGIRAALADDKLPEPVRSALADRLLESLDGALLVRHALDSGSAPAATRAALLTKIAALPRGTIRGLFENLMTPEQRGPKLATVASADEILKLTPDIAKGEQLFASGSLSGAGLDCKSCHSVHGVGGSLGLGPDLSIVGHKLDRKAILAAVLEPAQAVAPAYVPYVLESQSGQIHTGYLVEKNDREVVLNELVGSFPVGNDPAGKLLRVPAAEVVSLKPVGRSLMPDFAFAGAPASSESERSAAAQNVADVVGYLVSLTHGEQPITLFRTIGPFEVEKGKLDKAGPPEASYSLLASPDLAAKYKNAAGQELQWGLAPTGNSLGFPAIVVEPPASARDAKSPERASYFFAMAESSKRQTVTLRVGNDGKVKLWVNGQLSHVDPKQHGLEPGASHFTVRFKEGKNTILVKLQNGGTRPGGLALSLEADEPLELSAE